MLKIGTLVRITLAYEDMGDHYRALTLDGMFIQQLPDGREEIFLPDLRIMQVSPAKVSIRCYLDNPAYDQLRAELFPLLTPGAEREAGVVSGSENVAA